MNNKLQFEKDAPIAVFDSGVGGISVLHALLREMPNEDYLYFGDSLNAPYGTKDSAWVRERCFTLVEQFRKRGAKAVVVACNTATSAAVRSLRVAYPDYTIVGIEPALKPAVLCHRPECLGIETTAPAEGGQSSADPNRTILVMATPMTIRNEKFHNLMDRYADQAHILPLPCPGLMEFVERGETEGQALCDFINRLFTPFDKKKINAIVLGCTHYPFVAHAIRQVMGEEVALYEGGPGTARETKRRLSEQTLLNMQDKKGTLQIENTLSEEKVALCRQLIEGSI